MHFKLNWIFIDGIHFKRIENWLHNGSRKTQKHDVNLTLNECHRTIRYQKKGEWTSKSLRCCGCEFFLLFLQKKCDIIFFEILFRSGGKRERDEKSVELDFTSKSSYMEYNYVWFFIELSVTQSTHSRLIYSVCSSWHCKKQKYSVTQSYGSHAEFGCKNR